MSIVQQGSAAAGAASSQGIASDEILHLLRRESGDVVPDPLLALQWLNDRYREVWDRVGWPFAEKEVVFSTVAEITSDSVTVNNGSTTVTETTSNSKWTSSINGRKFRAASDSEYYAISGYSNANPDTFTLDRNYEGTSGTVVGYSIFQNIYSLAGDVARILSIRRLDEERPLEKVSGTDLDIAFPARQSPGNPTHFAIAGRDSNDIYQIELYPPPDEAHGYICRYLEEPPALTGGQDETVPFTYYRLLKYGWKADYWRWRATLATVSGAEPANAVQEEALFEKALQEMVARESVNMPNSRLRLVPRLYRHRILRANKFSGNVFLDST